MKNLCSSFLLLLALCCVISPVSARTSPHETISTVVDGSRVMVVYGRPYSKDPKSGETRKIWGTLIPWGQVWRAGADEATLLITQKPLVFSGVTVPAGAYTLWVVPQQDGTAKLVINKQIGQWGVPGQYDEKQDLARIDLKKESLDHTLDQFTMAILKNPGGGGNLTLGWENTQYSVPFTVQK